MNASLKNRKLKQVMIFIIVLTGFLSAYAQAGMVPTSAVINSEGVTYSTHDLHTALATEELKQQLHALGVDVSELNDRIASLTPAEISQLNDELAEKPAGGVLGIILTIFIIFIVTDMLCATDIFSFVKCINK